MKATVVYVHGLWMGGRESLFLRRRLERSFGYETHFFTYPTVSAGMAEITNQLQAFISKLRPQTLHLVGHSLGGLVIHRFFERFPHQPPGRVVFLGTPAVKCMAARRASRMRWMARLMGRAVAEELLEEKPRVWRQPRELGIIAGTQPLGLGQFLAQFDEPCDGTVAVSETRMPGATDQITLHVSHVGLLLSPRVAYETGRFLRDGHFSLSAPLSQAYGR